MLHTLSSDTSVARDSYPFTHPIFPRHEMSVVFAPDVLLLQFVGGVVGFGENQGGHEDPFGDGWTVDSTRCCDDDVCVFDDGMR